MKLVACPKFPKDEIAKIVCMAGATVCPYCGNKLPGRHKTVEILKEAA